MSVIDDDQTVYASAELRDGTRYAGVRVPLASKFQWERSAKANGWDPQTNPFTFAAFLSWHAGKDAGHHDLTWTQFTDAAIDATVTDERPADQPDDTPDPTRPGQREPGTEAP